MVQPAVHTEQKLFIIRGFIKYFTVTCSDGTVLNRWTKYSDYFSESTNTTVKILIEVKILHL